jgi:competence protein ComEA
LRAACAKPIEQNSRRVHKKSAYLSYAERQRLLQCVVRSRLSFRLPSMEFLAMLKKLLMLCVALVLSMSAAFAASVDVNTADQATLESLKGLGPVKSKAIIDERAKNGPFKDADDLAGRVKGIGAKTVTKLEAEGLTIGGSSAPPAGASKKTAASATPPAKSAGKSATKMAAPAATTAATSTSAAASAPAAASGTKGAKSKKKGKAASATAASGA